LIVLKKIALACADYKISPEVRQGKYRYISIWGGCFMETSGVS
jgi:hypothetical protein